jgi:hypothetical protein
MNLSLTWLNCFWLSLPLLAWNLLLGSKLTQEQIASAAHSPAWLLGAENVFRLATFSLPLFLRLQLDSNLGKIGLAVYLLGRLVYFASWILLIWAPQAAWSQSLPGLFAPRLTPLIWLIGVALSANSWLYALLATLFIFFHTWHGINNLEKLPLSPPARFS